MLCKLKDSMLAICFIRAILGLAGIGVAYWGVSFMRGVLTYPNQFEISIIYAMFLLIISMFILTFIVACLVVAVFGHSWIKAVLSSFCPQPRP